MQVITLSNYILIGITLRYLQGASKGHRVQGEGGVIDAIDKLIDSFEQFSLPVSFRAASDLDEFKDYLVSTKAKELSRSDVDELHELASMLRQTILAEAEGCLNYVTEEKRYPVEKLINDVSFFMSKGTFRKLPEMAKYDFSEAGNCIAFDRSTAAAFHLLRGTEGVLKHLYCCYVKRNRVANPTMGGIIHHFRSKTTRKKPTREVMEQLDIIRENYRNPTQHPEKKYDISEAQTLFGLCLHAVEIMVADKNYTKP